MPVSINPILQHSNISIFYHAQKSRIPTPLRKLTNNEERVAVNAATIGEAIRNLTVRSL
jgi:hypothetical protein